MPVAAPPPSHGNTIVTNSLLPDNSIPFPVAEQPPVTTVFVGNIPDTISDSTMKNILTVNSTASKSIRVSAGRSWGLQAPAKPVRDSNAFTGRRQMPPSTRCGNILKWKRVQGPTGKLQAFGFCEYERPESTMRCVRLLNGLEIHAKKLLVKVDSKTEETLAEYFKKQLAKNAAESEEQKNRDDEKVRAALNSILENAPKVESEAGDQIAKEKRRELDWQSMQDMDLDDEKRSVIEREVSAFRNRFERTEFEKSVDSSRRGGPSAVGVAAMKLAPDSVNNVEIRDNYRRRERSRSRSPRRKNAGPTGTITAFSAKDRGESGQEKDRDPEEEAIRRRLERKLREKEDSYQRLLDEWTSRERKKAIDYEREAERESKKNEDLVLEAERLKEFFETYDDELEDVRYYRSSAMQRRLAARETEQALDERDRQREVEQIEIARQKLMDEGDPNAESIILQMEQKMQEHLRPSLDLEATECPTVPPLSTALQLSSRYAKAKTPTSSPEPTATNKDPLQISLAQNPGHWQKPNERFTADLQAEEEEEEQRRKEEEERRRKEEETPKPKYTPGWLPPSAKVQQQAESPLVNTATTSQLTEDEKRNLIRDIIKRIPTDKDLLFAYPLEWDVVDSDFVATHIRPWVDKKMLEYIGEAEPALCKFICDQVHSHNPPNKILVDISMVLDEEADDFVVKLWRLLIYIIAAKKAGLA
ncbi:putative RNA-binding protein 25 [Cichlidogyrus casuarinus]|uniref:RNA-binding protein 25 n=1 Tax=Cichlidogyrus casuarinus TaxID=1844966 RepID=A0ABD2PV94_9PLAT